MLPTGRAGARSAARNPEALAVIEGAGHHCCEYMTAGVVLVLGAVGRNFGAGMSNGVAYVLDETETFSARCNFDMVRVEPLAEADERAVLELVHQHLAKTGSPRAREVVGAWERYRAVFRKVVPHAVPAPAPEPTEAALSRSP